ncbi:hypothetical protein HC928_16815 [bacterium]|nr:hypothetical protein [bacterium]
MMPDAWQEPELSHPHNLILDFWTRLGLLGVLWITTTLGLFWRQMLTAYRAIKTDYNWPLDWSGMPAVVLIGAAGSMANLIAHGLIDNSVFVLDLAYIFMLLLAMAAAPAPGKNASAIDTGI